jgi:toxin ParE1/3/4
LAIRRHPAFFNDLDEAYDYLLGESPRAADLLFDRVEEVGRLLARFSHLGRRRDEVATGVRSFRVRGFRYLIFYRVENDDVLLIRMIHGAMNMTSQNFPD